MKEEGPGRVQGRLLRQPRREITPEKRREEGVRVQESAPGLDPGPRQETEAGRRREALQEPGQGLQEEDPAATRDPSVTMIRLPVVEVEAEEAEEVETQRGRLPSPTSAWVCLA